MRRQALLAALVLAAAPAAAQAPAAEPSAAEALRGSAPLGSAPAALRPSARALDTALISPGLQSPAAPRLRGLQEAPIGGAECRTACASNLYLCQGGGDAGEHCQQTWGACVLACPSTSGAL